MTQEIKEENINPNETTDDSKESQDFDLTKHGDLIPTTGGGKPTFETVQKVVIESCNLKTGKVKTDKKGKNYYPVWLSITFQKQGEETKFYENFGGGHLYPAKEGGKAEFWIGEKSALGRLMGLLKDNFGFEGSLKEILPLIKGKIVGVKSETQTVAGETYMKNIIQAFYV